MCSCFDVQFGVCVQGAWNSQDLPASTVLPGVATRKPCASIAVRRLTGRLNSDLLFGGGGGGGGSCIQHQKQLKIITTMPQWLLPRSHRRRIFFVTDLRGPLDINTSRPALSFPTQVPSSLASYHHSRFLVLLDKLPASDFDF